MTTGGTNRKAGGTKPPAKPDDPPRPAASYAFNFAGAVLLSAILIVQLIVNKHDEHPNVYLTYGLAFGVLFLLGVPVNKLLSFVLRLLARAQEPDDG